ncbi:MAG: energy-coupling factor transporter transmembrane protein EcfT [Actinomycetota bacterium]|nr:energy-coupling factor transporter transmembrane protein EcfT [Actinomycetota bacterium]
MTAAWRLPRPLHPGAWWLWALGLATAASRTTDPLLLLLVACVAGYVVAARRTDAPWARAYAMFLRLAFAVLLIRVGMHALFGAGVPGHTLLSLPSVPLPHWAAGVRIGGPVTLEGLAAAAYDGLRIGVLLACVGAANALASPRGLLRCLPAALYEAGVVVSVAVSFAPQAVVAVGRVRSARRLRGRSERGPRALRGLLMPVLQDALDRSLELAAAMDSRGYGRRAAVPARGRRLTAACTGVGLLAVCAGVYGLLDGGSPAVVGVPSLLIGIVLAVLGLAISGRRTARSRYRPAPWTAAEWLVAGSGVLAAAAMILAALLDVPGLVPQTSPLTLPALPLLPTVGILAALLPAWAAPVAVSPDPAREHHLAPAGAI